MNNNHEVLSFIQARMINVHGENPNVDYMHALERVVQHTAREQGQIKPEVGFVSMMASSDIERARLFLENPGSLYIFTSGQLGDSLEDNLVEVTSLRDLCTGNKLYVKKELTWLEQISNKYGYLEYDDNGGMRFSRKQMGNFVEICHLVASVTEKPGT